MMKQHFCALRRQFKPRQLNSLSSDLFVTQHITADQFVINASHTPRHHDNETWPRCPGVSRSQILLVKNALLLVCALLTVIRKACKTCEGYEMFHFYHLLVRLPIFSITPAVQQVPLCPPMMLMMALCLYGCDVFCTFQRNLHPLTPLVICCPAPAAVQLRLGCITTTGGQGGGVQRGAASCKEVVIQFSALC